MALSLDDHHTGCAGSGKKMLLDALEVRWFCCTFRTLKNEKIQFVIQAFLQTQRTQAALLKCFATSHYQLRVFTTCSSYLFPLEDRKIGES